MSNQKPTRYFEGEPQHQALALELYTEIQDLPLICPHGHVDPMLFSDSDYSFGTPVDLLIIPDHYIFRMFYSQGIALETLGIQPLDGSLVEEDHRKIWQTFAEHFYLFRGTPTGMWLQDELIDVFDVEQKLNGENRELYETFNIEVLCTTDAATDSLAHHQAIRDSGWSGRICPTFRPDNVVNLGTVGWQQNIETLGEVSGVTIHNYATFIQALEAQRSHFKKLGAVATDHATLVPCTELLNLQEAETIFQRALQNQATADDAIRFTGHMLMENARMSVEDGLVMQLHNGSYRGHNELLRDRFGNDMGADIPVQNEYTQNLRPLLNHYGNDPRFQMILFTLDETTYARELAPLAGHYPAIKLGPPWWFHDSLNGIQRYFDQVMETAGLYNTAGFNDDTRAFPSIPARHDLWRRASASWVAGLLIRSIVDEEDAQSMIVDLQLTLSQTNASRLIYKQLDQSRTHYFQQ